MAASMKSHARICLLFECAEIEASWHLVKYLETPLISDVCERINSLYSLVTKKRRQLELRLKSSILPQWESSELLQDNDKVAVSIVKKRSSKSNWSGSKDTINKADRKRKRTYILASTELGTVELVPEIKKKRETSTHASPEEGTDEDENKLQAAFQRNGESIEIIQPSVGNISASVAEKEIDQVQSRLIEISESTPDDTTTTKRKRVRKHRKRNSNNCDGINGSDKGEDTFIAYKGRDIGKNEVFFGSIPDKLVSPQNYRHGYRNLNVYKPDPNKHTKFESDEEINVKENTEQYNFLSSTRLLEERDAHREGMGIENEGNECNGMITDEIKETNECGQTVMQDRQSITNGVNACNGYQSDTVSANENKAALWKYPSSEPRPVRENIRPQPSSLARKTLASGVSVFVRQRPSKFQQYGSQQYEMSKEDQLSTVARNVSTIFVNPSSPIPKETDQRNQTFEQQNGHDEKPRDIKPVYTSSCLDYSKLPPLKGIPKKGEKIVYKILEISASCTPEMSEFREAVVLDVDKNQMVELRNTNGPIETKKNRFHVEMEDENEVLTNTSLSQEVVQCHLSSLLDARVVESH